MNLKKMLLLTTIPIFFILTFSSISLASGWEVGLKYNRFTPPESAYWGNTLEDDFPQLTLNLERMIFKSISFGVSVGYSEKLDENTEQYELRLVPAAASLKWNYEIVPNIVLFIGGGLDVWWAKGTHEPTNYKNEKEVGGYHGTVGLKLYTADEMFKGLGLLLEATHSTIDRFGENRKDIGGPSYNIGVVYSF